MIANFSTFIALFRNIIVHLHQQTMNIRTKIKNIH